MNESSDAQPEPETEVKEKEFVIMPDVSFQLKNNVGGGDFGAVSISLQNYVGPDVYSGAWFEQVADRLSKVPPEFQNLVPIKNCPINPHAVTVHVDVFAERDGLLRWHPDMRMGRNVRMQRLFKLSRANQYLNEGDFMLNDQAYLDDEFECAPLLYCDRNQQRPFPDANDTDDMHRWEDWVLKPFADFLCKDSDGPKWRTKLLHEFDAEASRWKPEIKQFKKQMAMPKEASELRMGRWKTGRLSDLMKVCGWRWKSMNHRPLQVYKRGNPTVVLWKYKNYDQEIEDESSDSDDDDDHHDDDKVPINNSCICGHVR